MAYLILADAAMLVHFVVLLYLVFGGFLAWRWRWTIVPHVAMVSWGVLILLAVVDCPLTSLEDWARRRAGEQGLPRGFIDTYLTGVIYSGERRLGGPRGDRRGDRGVLGGPRRAVPSSFSRRRGRSPARRPAAASAGTRRAAGR